MAKPSTTRNREQTLNKIYEECVALAAEVGIDNLQAEEISKRSKISRPLLNHYFPQDLKQSLRQFLIERVSLDFKTYIDQALARETRPDRVLKTYVHSHFQWGREYPAHMGTLLALFPLCVTNETVRKANTVAVQSGAKRLEFLLHYRCDKPSKVTVIARSFQIFLTGAVISYFTEDHENRRLDPEKLVLDYLDSLLDS